MKNGIWVVCEDPEKRETILNSLLKEENKSYLEQVLGKEISKGELSDVASIKIHTTSIIQDLFTLGEIVAVFLVTDDLLSIFMFGAYCNPDSMVNQILECLKKDSHIKS